MTFEVELGARVRTVSVEQGDQPGRWRVTLDGELHVLDVARIEEFGWSILRTVPADTGTVTQSAELQICPGLLPGERLVWLGGRVVSVTTNGRRGPAAADGPHRAEGEIAIVAPMPGRVVRVLVAPGEDVTARQAVIVVEAMKMENELRVPRAGRVREITVSAGASVEAGRILAVIE
jgi:acetyl/propionyl-CoA carboxylase alpha subunit